jgi:MFS family permease
MLSLQRRAIRQDAPRLRETKDVTVAQGTADAPAVGGRAWYALVVLTLIYTCHYIDRSVLSVLVEPIKGEFRLTDGQVGVLTGLAFGLLYASAGIPIGMLIDRVNRRNLLAVLVFVWSAFTAVCGLAQSYLQLLFARFAVGMAESGGSPAAMSMLTDIFPPKRRSMAVGFFWMSTSFGAAVALSVGGLVAATFGWRTAFFVAGAPGVLLMIVREPKRGATEDKPIADEKPPTLAETFRHAVQNRMFVFSFLGMISNSVVGSGILMWEVAFLMRVHDLPISQAGLTVGAIALFCGATSTFLGGYIADKLTKKRGLRGAALVPAFSGVLTAAAGLNMVTAGTPGMAILGMAIWELCYRLYFGPGNNLVLSNVPPRMRGVAASASQAAANLLGFGMGPMVIGLVSDFMLPRVGKVHSLQWGIGSVLVFSLVTSLMFTLAARSAPRATAQERMAPVRAVGVKRFTRRGRRWP